MASEGGHTQYPLLKSLISGGVGGMCLVLVGQPFDLVKVRLQTSAAVPASSASSASASAASASRVSALSITRDVLRSEGVRGLYRGMAAPLAGVTPIFALCFWAYEASKGAIASARGLPSTRALGLGDVAVAGALSAVPTTLIMAPGERVKVLLQTQGAAFKGPGDVVRHLYHTGGVRSLFAGSAATLARDGSGSMAYFALYEGLRRWAGRAQAEEAEEAAAAAAAKKGHGAAAQAAAAAAARTAAESAPPSASVILIAGGLAGMSHWLVALPLDTIKSRIQSQVSSSPGAAASSAASSAASAASAASGASTARPSGVFAVAQQVMATQGVRGFYRGLAPALLRAFPANAACFAGMEASRAVMDKFM